MPDGICCNSPVESNKPPAVFYGNTKQVSVCNLPVPDDCRCVEMCLIQKRDIFRPQLMIGPGGYLPESRYRIPYGHRAQVAGPGYNTNETILGRWRRSPSRLMVVRVPLLSLPKTGIVWIKQRQ